MIEKPYSAKALSWSRFSAAILPLHDCQSIGDLSAAFLLSMRALLEAEVHAVNWFGALKIRDISTHSGQLIPGALEILNQHLADHPLLPIVEATKRDGMARAARWSDFTPLRRFRDTGLYHDFFRPLSVNRQVGLTLSVNKSLALGLSFNRMGRDYQQEDAQALEALAPHFVFCARSMLAKAEVERAILLRDIALQEEAVAIVNEKGMVLLATDPARQLFQDYFSLLLDRGLPAPMLAQFSHNEPMLNQTVATRHGGTLRCSSSAVTAWPVHLRASWLGSDDDSREVRCLRFTEERHAPDLKAWERTGLTPKESEVLHWIIQGKRDGEIAEILTASARTVQKHVQNILRKLRVETRTAAAAEAMRKLTARD